ncbi:MAG: rod shape-determining protein MreC [Desulfomonilaceae bacterium]
MPRSAREIGLVLLLIGLGLIILFSSLSRNESVFFSETFNKIVEPLYSSTFFINNKIKGLFHSYLFLVGLNKENQVLKEENSRLRMENATLLEKANENERLRKFVGLKITLDHPSLLAQVIGMDASGVYRTVIINRGLDDGVSPNMPVVVAEGVIGKTLVVSEGMSQVGLITDPSVSIDSRIDRTRDRGVLVGDSSNACVLKYLNRKASVIKGDRVITSGLDGIFPKGLLVGIVESIQPGPQGLFLEAIVQPSANFYEMEEVLVVLVKQGGFHIEPGLDAKK